MKLVLNIEKRHAYAIIGLLIILVGVVAVGAYNAGGSGGNPAVMGHDASEVGAGSFSGDSYDFLYQVGIGTFRATNPLPGTLWLRGGQNNNDNLITLKNDGSGNFKIFNGASSYFSVKKDGNICLGATCKTSWTTGTLQSQWVYPCPAGWIDTGLSDCDSGDGHAVEENSCTDGPVVTHLCLRIA
ncbi:MAG: hypothetical protein WC584_02150 [Candidatus Pacearchaeota archaeon]